MDSSYSNIKYWLDKYELRTNKLPRFKCQCGEADPKKLYGNKRYICGKCHNKYVIEKGRDNKKKMVDLLGGKCQEVAAEIGLKPLASGYLFQSYPNEEQIRKFKERYGK